MMIKKKMILSCVLVALFAMGNVAFAGTETLNASATITSPTLQLTNPTAMTFGGIITGNDPSSVIVLDSSSNTASTPALLSGDAALDGNGNSGTLTVESNVDATLTVTCTGVSSQQGNADKLEQYSGSDSIDMAATSVENYTPGTLAVTANTPETLHIGGLISVANTVGAGSYSGTVTIDVSY